MRLKVGHIGRYLNTHHGCCGDLRVVFDDLTIFSCKTLEQPWYNNAPFESCIPEGLYKIKRGMHNRLNYKCYEIPDVNGRSLIKIHRGNTIGDILGCILVGQAINTNVDGRFFITDSGETLANLIMRLEEQDAWLSITDDWT
jgi:hypothetical protein